MLTFCLQDNNKTEQTGVTIFRKQNKTKRDGLEIQCITRGLKMQSPEGGPVGLQDSDCIGLSFSAKETQICRDAVKFTNLVGYC